MNSNERIDPNAPLESLESLLSGADNALSCLANASAFLWAQLPDINWLGFYLLDRGLLWLGPFQGKVACTQIGTDRGVCGAAFSAGQTLIVPDVHQFPGHIACDEASRSEIVVPLRAMGRVVGVLDVDSPRVSRFTDADRMLLEGAVQRIERHVDFSRCGYDLRL